MLLLSFNEKAITFLSRHCIPLIFSLAVGLISVAPQFLAPNAIGDSYNGLPFLYHNDEEVYVMRIQEVLDGHWNISSPAYYGYKDTASLQMPFGEYLYALPAFIFGIFPVIVFYKFLFPTLLFLLVYIFIRQLSPNASSGKDQVLNALTGALLVVIGYEFVDFRWVWNLLIGNNDHFYLSVWTRPVNPITGSLFLFSFLIFLYQFTQTGKNKLLIFAGFLLMLMSGYVFSYSLAGTILICITIIYLLQKNYLHAWKLFIVGVAGLLPVVFQTIKLYKFSVFSASNSITKNGLFFTHEPLINKFLVVVTLLFIIFSVLFFKKHFFSRVMGWWWMCLTILVSLFIVFNQQVITGITIWPQHFVQYSIPLIYVVGITLLFNIVRPLFPRLWKVIMAIIIITTISFGIWSTSSLTPKIPSYKEVQNYAPLFEWFNTHAPKDCVVLAPMNFISKFPAYTHCNAYYSDYHFIGVPQERVEHGYMSLLRFQGVSENNRIYFLENKKELVNVIFDDWTQKYYDMKDPWLLKLQKADKFEEWFEKERERLSQNYHQFLRASFKEELKKYPLDYVVIREEQEEKSLTQIREMLQEVGHVPGFVIFKVI